MLKDIVKWISDYSKDNNLSPLVVGISGGIDSALVSTLCAMTGIDTLVMSLPIHQKDDQLLRARNHAKWLSEKFDNVEFIEKDLSGLFENFKSIFSENEMNVLSLANSRSRLRMVTLYQMAGSKGGMVIGTGNKIEDFGVGFFTKYGDGGVDISPIGDLTKTQVRNLSSELGIIEEIIV
jgi:NAD+ synthase